MNDLVLVERQGPLVVLTLNRPDARNALSRALLVRLGELGRELSAAPEVRAVVLTGAGDRAFSAGADLKERRGMNDAEIRAQLMLYRTELAWLGAQHFPTVAALNGAALGGGLELALACDLRVAAPGIELGLPETSLGIIPGAGGTQRLVRLVGEARAKEMILLGRRVSAENAHAFGLIQHLAAGVETLLGETIEYMKPILEGAPVAQRAALKAIAAASELPLEQGLEVERQCYETCLGTEDRKEALAAFAEKRKPRFLGK